MARSGETFGKKEKEKNRAKHRQDKAEKMEERKANAKKGKSLDEMMAYIDENGNLSSVPPDPKKMKIFKQEDMRISATKNEQETDVIRTGMITFFNGDKGYGFIKDAKTGESIFIHINQASWPVKEGDKVSFEVEMGPKGSSAVNVNKAV